MALDMEKLNAFVGQFVGDLGAAVHSGIEPPLSAHRIWAVRRRAIF
jgi:hypothetical protein